MIPVCLPNIASCAVWVQSGSLRQNFSAPHCLSSLPLTAIKPPLCSFYTGLNCRTLSIFSVCILFRKANGNEMSLKPDRTWTTHPPSLWNVNEQQQGRQLLKRTPERPLQLHWVAGGMWVGCETPPALTNSKSNAIGLVLLSTVKKNHTVEHLQGMLDKRDEGALLGPLAMGALPVFTVVFNHRQPRVWRALVLGWGLNSQWPTKTEKGLNVNTWWGPGGFELLILPHLHSCESEMTAASLSHTHFMLWQYC